jgi:hypothetical protein
VKLRDIPFSLRHSLANRGVIRSVAIAPRIIVSRLLRGSAQEKQAVLSHPFDAEFGTDTGGMIYAEELRDGRGRKSVYSTMTADASSLSDGKSHRKSSVATNAPASWADTNPATSAGLIPANVLLADRARVTAGLAKDVEGTPHETEIYLCTFAESRCNVLNCLSGQRQRIAPCPRTAHSLLRSC